MSNNSILPSIPGLAELRERTKGSSDISVAVLDGLVDTAHPCFEQASFTRLPTLIQGKASASGQMSTHGTHIASLIFGQPKTSMEGIAPSCRGLLTPKPTRNVRLARQYLS